jgi:hypothetical protein
MSSSTTDNRDTERIRAEYDEFTVGSSTVGMISDPLNEHAWIQSTVTAEIDP